MGSGFDTVQAGLCRATKLHYRIDLWTGYHRLHKVDAARDGPNHRAPRAVLRMPRAVSRRKGRLLAALVAAAQRLTGRVALVSAVHRLYADALQVANVARAVMLARTHAAIDLLMTLVEHFHRLLEL